MKYEYKNRPVFSTKSRLNALVKCDQDKSLKHLLQNLDRITEKDLRRNVKSHEGFHIHIASQVYLNFCFMLSKLKLKIEKMD